MSEWYDNRSAEVVLREPHNWSAERNCLDCCLKKLNASQLSLILQIFGEQRNEPEPRTFLSLSAIELKKIRSRLAKCIKACLEDAADNDFPDDFGRAT